MRTRPVQASISYGQRAEWIPSPGRNRTGSRARRGALLAALLAIVLILAGCGGSGGGGSSDTTPQSSAQPLMVEPVDLPVGQTVATVAWEPSEGPVDGYLVYVSRNGGGYWYHGFAATPSDEIEGGAGETVRVIVVATTPLNDRSEASAPSPPIRFHAAEAAAAVAATMPGGGIAIAAADTPDTAPGESAEEAATPVAAPETTAQPDAQDLEAEASATDAEQLELDLAERGQRERWLRSEPRLALDRSSAETTRWLQDRVDVLVAAGVSLVGTGHLDADGLRDLVWRDAGGQILVSSGDALVSGEAPPDTLEPTIRLHPTERLVALRDLDGDGTGDWLFIDGATDELWQVNGATDVLTPVPSPSDARLVGVGDFGDDRRSRLLWRTRDDQLLLSDGELREPSVAPIGAAIPDGLTILAIADLDGDGRDDLLGRDEQARLVLAHTRADDAAETLALSWRVGPVDRLAEHELLGTLDFDGDARTEIAWLTNGVVEVWDADRLEQATSAD